jgi:hypothetical protein
VSELQDTVSFISDEVRHGRKRGCSIYWRAWI